MIWFLFRFVFRPLLWLRYRITVRGLKAVAARGRKGILFLPNHPALIDPALVQAVLRGQFRPRALADQKQVDRPFIRTLARKMRLLVMPDPARDGAAARVLIAQAVQRCVEALQAGERCDMEAGMAKLFSTEAALSNATEAMRIHGAYGYSKEFEVERLYRDAPLLCIGEGTNELQRHLAVCCTKQHEVSTIRLERRANVLQRRFEKGEIDHSRTVESGIGLISRGCDLNDVFLLNSHEHKLTPQDALPGRFSGPGILRFG